jgi:Holliday junction DNA helicase RuvA
VIAFLHGTLAEKGAGRVVIDVGGVGYEVLVPTRTLVSLPPAGRATRLFTRLSVREDAMTLFGFGTADERTFFDDLVTVTGVGPKLALAVLSVLTPDALRRAIATGDAAALTQVPGVGKKGAARIILDLKDKLGVGGDETVGGAISEVRDALLSLGLSPEEAREAIAGLPSDVDRPVEELLRQALRSVGR